MHALIATAALAAEIPLPALLADAGPFWSGAGTATACASEPVTLGAVVDGIARVERATTNLRLPEARAELDTLDAALACLSEPAAAGVVSRVPYLRGIVATMEGRGTDAEEAFVAALVAAPALAWDDRYPPDGRPAWERARARVAALTGARVRLVPEPPPGATWVDGRVAQTPAGVLSLPPGDHLLQVAGSTWITWRIAVPPGGESTLVRAAEVPPDAWLATPELRDGLAAALGTLLPTGTPVRVPDETGAWTLLAGEPEWRRELLPPPRPDWRWMSWAGGGVLAGAVVGGALAWVEFADAQAELGAAGSVRDFEAQRARGEAAARVVQGAEWTAAGGATLLAAGITLQFAFGEGR